jgi:hypothetical protein
MSFVAVAVGVGTVAVGAYSANRASSSARNAQRGADRASEAQEAIQREQLEEARRQRAQWEERFFPAFDAMADQAFAAQRPDFESVEADIGRQFDTSRGINERNRMRFGYNPTDGAMADDERQYGMARALATAGGRNAARNVARDEGFNRLTRYIDAGQGLRASADGMQGAAYAGIASAFGQRAGMQQGLAGQFRQQAADSWSDVGTGLGYMTAGGWGGGGGGMNPSAWQNAQSTGNWGAFTPRPGNYGG